MDQVESQNQQKNNEKSAERQVLEQLAFASLEEQKKSRRWGLFFKLFTVVYLLLFLIMVMAGNVEKRPSEFTAVVDLHGAISDTSEASADRVVTGLQKAFESDGTKGVILRSNSPGGSPVQSAYINKEIKRLRKKYPKIPLYVVISDVCASGCYYAAVAAEKIYANESSIVGSIGVIMNGFGFVGSMKKLGIERRLMTAGKNKGLLDPFSPENPQVKNHLQNMLNEVHTEFINVVKEGRGESVAENKEIFSGLVWSGRKAKELGLVDGFASTSEIARDIFKAKEIVNFSYHENVLDRFARQLGASLARTFSEKIPQLQLH